jgi:biopolymer transport protein ExbD
VVIAIASNGEVRLNSQPPGAAEDQRLEALRIWFRDTIREYGDGDPVLIRPAADVRHQQCVDVLDAVSASGVKHLSFG